MRPRVFNCDTEDISYEKLRTSVLQLNALSRPTGVRLRGLLDDLTAIQDRTLHDPRRTAAIGMARLKAAPHVVERILNRASGSLMDQVPQPVTGIT